MTEKRQMMKGKTKRRILNSGKKVGDIMTEGITAEKGMTKTMAFGL